MEKKIIDLSKETGEFEVILPSDFTLLPNNNHRKSLKIKVKEPDPFDLVPKSFEELMNNVPLFEYAKCEKIPLEYLIDHKNCQTRCINEEDRNAFLALIKLRRLWHEWVKVLGAPTPSDLYHNVIIYNDGEKITTANTNRTNGMLIFGDIKHAEKFIECFGDLLEKAKILL